MTPSTARPDRATLDDYVEAFEQARAAAAPTDLGAFLPPAGHPLYAPVLRELVRVDLEYGWRGGRPVPLEDYRARFPELFGDPEGAGAVAFEEYRLRLQAGQAPSPADYRQRFGVRTADWPLPGPAAGDFPEVGEEFLGFRLIAELGRGSFGRVYLARQGELADRPVALKVSPLLHGEARTLARLQHTNIVPVYSVHTAPPFQAVCMPYLGALTLADVLQRLHGRGSLPQSGKALVDTLVAGRSATHPGPAAAPPGPADPAAPAADPWQGLARLSYVEAVLWLGARLADGLAHAHDRGVLHRDLKPANVLLSDGGEPMLLDFNLAADAAESAGSAAHVGGTLPYMSPEQLDGFRGGPRALDGRSDLFALGVLLFELLSGKAPYPAHKGVIPEVLAAMAADRRQGPPPLRGAGVTPAVAAVVRRCLQPDPANRYPSARALREDLERQLAHLPLAHTREPSPRERARKWARRHPRLCSAGGVAALAGCVVLALALGLLGYRHRALRREALAGLAEFRAEAREARLYAAVLATDRGQWARGAALGRRALGRYGALDGPGWEARPEVARLPEEERARLREEVGELLLLLAEAEARGADRLGDGGKRKAGLAAAWALNESAAACYPDGEAPRAVWLQRAELSRLAGDGDEAAWRARAEQAPLRTAHDRYLVARGLALQGKFAEATPLLREAVRHDPRDFWAWFLLARCCDEGQRNAQAVACYSTCTALWPEFAWSWFNRGLAHLRQGQHADAAADFGAAIGLRPDLADAYVNRALARLGGGDAAGAVADLDRALELDPASPRVYFMRAQARARAGDAAGARADREEGRRRRPDDEHGWVARGLAWLPDQPGKALADFDQALALNPRYYHALQNKASVLSENLRKPREAVAVLDKAVALYPNDVRARGGRAVLLARLGRRAAALADARACLALDTSPSTLYQLAGVYALTAAAAPGDKREALRLLAEALRGGFGLDLLERDTDLDPVRDDPEFRRLVAAARALRGK